MGIFPYTCKKWQTNSLKFFHGIVRFVRFGLQKSWKFAHALSLSRCQAIQGLHIYDDKLGSFNFILLSKVCFDSGKINIMINVVYLYISMLFL